MMRIAIPTASDQLAVHFGHCRSFAFFDVDTDACEIRAEEHKTPPEHQPGVLPAWLAEQGAEVIIAGGMGMRAQNLFGEHGIRVLVGAPAGAPAEVVKSFLNGTLATGENVCDH